MNRSRSAVLFDLYGTLAEVEVEEDTTSFWDSLASDFFGREFAVSGDSLRRAYRRLLEIEQTKRGDGFLLDVVFAGLLKEFGKSSGPAALEKFANSFRRQSIVRLVKKEYSDPLLRRIRNAGYKLGLVSNTEALLTNYDLQALDLNDKFDEIVLSSNLGIKKPDKRIFDEILGRLGSSPGGSVFVGDNFQDDIVGALNAHLDVVFLTAAPEDTALDHVNDRNVVVTSDFDLEHICRALEELGYQLAQG